MTRTQRSWQWYDENADIYQEMDPATIEFGRQLLEYADPPAGARLLDIGAGRGAVAGPAVARGCTVTAVDAAPGMVARLRQDFPRITASEMDAHRFTFADGSFDFVTAGFVLDLLADPAAALSEMWRVLRPGGVVAVSVPGPLPHRERWQWLVDLAGEFYPTSVREDPPAKTTVDIPVLLAATGFRQQEQRDFHLPVPVAGPAALWEVFASRLPTAMSAGWVDRLDPDRAADFRRRFLAGAEDMHRNGGITMDRYMIMHRATVPWQAA
jgi:SAM-dependent methyltransferase